MLADFLEMGFKPIVTFHLKGDRFAPDSFSWKDSSGWLYAIVTEGEVKYVGLTGRVLRSRIDDYRHGVGEQGSRINGLVLELLRAGKAVQMYGKLAPDASFREAEELRLRTEYSLPWNRV